MGIALVASAAGYLFLRQAQQGQPIDAGATRMTIGMDGFTPNSLSVRAGSELRIDLIDQDNAYHSDGGGKHNFVLTELAVNILVEPESQRVFSLTPSSPGTYTWYCDICCGGKDNPSMLGTLTVTA